MFENSNSKLLLAVSYVGLAYNGLERANGGRTIEGDLLTAIASVIISQLPTANISFVNISRASSTDAGAHATSQIITLELADASLAQIVLENYEQVNAYLSTHSSIRIAGVRSVDSDFSARRTCDTRTVEVYIPTYVFASPPEGTHYFSNRVDEPNPDALFAPHVDSVLTNLKRSLSRKSTRKEGLSPIKTMLFENQHDNVMLDAVTPPNTAVVAEPGTKMLPSPVHEQGSAIRRLFTKLMQRTKTEKRADEPTHEIKVMTDLLPFTDKVKTRRSEDQGMLSTLKRSLSRSTQLKRSNTTTSTRQRYMGVEFEPIEQEQQSSPIEEFAALEIAAPGEEAKSNIRGYRMEEAHFATFTNIIQLYRGTHNFHNFLQDADPQDSKAFVRIIDAQVESPSVHEGMEWIKVKFTSKGFGKTQVRKMIALAVMVTRTNTPRSVVGNAFGASLIEVPQFPPFGVVLEDLSFETYLNTHKDQLDMEKFKAKFLAFKKEFILPSIYKFEKEYLSVEPFIRSLDSYSFLYAHFLNDRGVVRAQTAYLRASELL